MEECPNLGLAQAKGPLLDVDGDEELDFALFRVFSAVDLTMVVLDCSCEAVAAGQLLQGPANDWAAQGGLLHHLTSGHASDFAAASLGFCYSSLS